MALLCIDQHQRWSRGERVPVEAYLERYPALATDTAAVLDLIFSEVLLRKRLGERPQLEEYARRFGPYEPQVREQFSAHLTRSTQWQSRAGPQDAGADSVPDSHPTRGDPRQRRGARPATEDWPTVPGYELLEVLGEGGMGVVYKARQKDLKRLVALKVVRADGGLRTDDLVRFRNEAETAARLQHPHIVQIHEVGACPTGPFLSLELVDGIALSTHIEGQAQPASWSARTVAVLAHAMHYAHEQGVVHRDLKPANVLLARDGTPKITDFGLAKQLDRDSTQTRSGVVLGTPAYMPPEQAAGRNREVGPLGDVYALGTLLYEALTGRPPFQGQTVLETLRQVTAEEPIAPRRLQPTIPLDLETICLKCLRKEPGGRYPTARCLAEDLDRFLAGQPVQARPASLREQAWKWARRAPTAAALLVVSLLAAIFLVSGGLFYGKYQAERARLLEMELAERAQGEELIAQARALVRSSEEAARRHDWQTARLHLERAEQALRDGSLAPAELRDQVRTLLAQARTNLEEQTTRDHVQQRLEQFRRQRDDALFSSTFLAGAGLVADPQTTRSAATQALRTAGIDPDADGRTVPTLIAPTAAEQDEVRRGCYELLLVLADLDGKAEGSPVAIQRALSRLNRAAGLGIVTRTYHERRATYLARLGDEAGAAQEREQAVARQPETALDLFLAGRDRLQAEQTMAAIRDLEGAVRRQPDHFWARYFLAVAYLKAQRLREGRTCLTACLDRRPEFVWLYLLRGFAQAEMNEFACAEEDFRSAARLVHDDSAGYALHINRATLWARQGKLNEAEADLQEAIRLRPGAWPAYVGLARVHQLQGRSDAALDRLDTAIRNHPRVAFLYRRRARLQLHRKDEEAAMRDLDAAIALDSTPSDIGTGPAESGVAAVADDHLQQGRIMHRRGRSVEALAAYDRALALRPEHLPAHQLRAEVLVELRRFADALPSLNLCLSKGPADAALYRLRGLVRSETGNDAAALEDYTRSLELRPDAGTYASRGWAYALVHEAPRLALRDFDESIRLDPTNGDAYAGRGLVRVTLGQCRPGVADAEEALRRGPPSARLSYNAARIYARAVGSLCAPDRAEREMRRGHEERALELLRQAVEAQPRARRSEFWLRVVHPDPAWSSLRRTAGFLRLAGEHTR